MRLLNMSEFLNEQFIILWHIGKRKIYQGREFLFKSLTWVLVCVCHIAKSFFSTKSNKIKCIPIVIGVRDLI